MRSFVVVTLIALLTGCAQPKMAEVSAGTRKVSFYQHGSEPLTYSFGVIDGLSFWAGGSPDAARNAAGPGAGIAAAVVSDTAKRAADERQVAARQVLREMSGNLSYTDQLSREVMPAIAGRLGTRYEPAKLQVIGGQVKIEDGDGNFLLPHSNEDLAVVVEVMELKLTEKPSIAGGVAAAFTAGLNDKNVAPALRARVAIFKRDDRNQLKRNWVAGCGAPVLLVPASKYFSELRADPTQGREMFNKALTVMLDNCRMLVTKAD